MRSGGGRINRVEGGVVGVGAVIGSPNDGVVGCSGTVVYSVRRGGHPAVGVKGITHGRKTAVGVPGSRPVDNLYPVSVVRSARRCPRPIHLTSKGIVARGTQTGWGRNADPIQVRVVPAATLVEVHGNIVIAGVKVDRR